MMPSPKALKTAQRKLDTDPELDQVMILSAPERRSLGIAIPKMEGNTAIVTCSDLGRDDWYIVTRRDAAVAP